MSLGEPFIRCQYTPQGKHWGINGLNSSRAVLEIIPSRGRGRIEIEFLLGWVLHNHMRDCLGRTRLWGFFPDEDDRAGGRHLYPPPLPEGEGVLIKMKIPHGTAECHDTPGWQITSVICQRKRLNGSPRQNFSRR